MLLTLALAACASDGALRPPLSRDIGPAPADLQEVEVAAPQRGESAFVIAERERLGREEANVRICSGRVERNATREALLAGKAPEDVVAGVPEECRRPVQRSDPVPLPRKKARPKVKVRGDK